MSSPSSSFRAGRAIASTPGPATPEVRGCNRFHARAVGEVSPSPRSTSMSGTKVAAKVLAKPFLSSPKAELAKPKPVLPQAAKPASSFARDSFDAAQRRSGPDLTGAPRAKSSATPPTVSEDRSGRTVVNLGAGDDTATVSQGPKGGLTITSGSSTIQLTAEQAENVVIKGGDGNDKITVDVNVTTGVAIHGGKGDDYLQGGSGDDSIRGGDGRDVVYGLGGNDAVSGGAGRDYLDGGRGDDSLKGDSGKDQVIGGRGNDTLAGGSGSDVLAGGAGKDAIDGGSGRDEVYSQKNDTVARSRQDTVTTVDLSEDVGTSVTVKGDANFQARVQSDLEALESLPVGRELLSGLDASGRSTTIRETSGGDSASPTNDDDSWLRPDGTPGPGSDATIRYNPTDTEYYEGDESWQVKPPVTTLFHELVHGYNYATGTRAPGETDGVNNRELAAVGLPYDHDGDASTPDIRPSHPTENKLREQLGLTPRPEY
ncbi:alkaline phosphatase [Myxococcus llanfairpwllgwyngyllgogerychwyrndrobwllllantysiliogogogochensis]|uniref:Alkaline phosphatase n=2 Tax=Myxococcus llanfairpwllgwyngyllgogerychwyrndrobwllllantysiliogogogochensis TaxID=2590453 RepID=A0A540X6A8_9BACT|nr:alkaline phosphatase [Myxococcus llanfairpwllgwyngyllgogerychwyrndrobwllllantysiliogogogochensis]